MFHLYVAMHQWGPALIYMPRHPKKAWDILFSVWTLLELRYTESCDSLCAGIHRRLHNADDFDRSCLFEALACHSAQKGWLDDAEAFWKEGTSYDAFEVNAWEGIVKVQAAKAHRLVAQGIKRIGERPTTYQVMLPHNGQQLQDDSARSLSRLQKKLRFVLPEQERWRFGIESSSSASASDK